MTYFLKSPSKAIIGLTCDYHCSPLAVDDGPTIKACKILDIRFTTAVHFLINMVDDGKMDRQMAKAKLEKLSFYGRYKRRIIDHALKRIEGGN